MAGTTAPSSWSFDEIGWLLDEVERAGGIVPPKFRRESDSPDAFRSVREARNALGRKIYAAVSWELLHQDLTSEARQKNRPKVARRINDQTQRLLNSLQEDPHLTRLLGAEMDMPPGMSMDDLVQMLAILQRAAGERDERPNHVASPVANTTAQEQFLQDLSIIYQNSEFGLGADPKHGITRKINSSRELVDMQGPFVEFVRCVYKLAGRQALTPAGLCKALQRASIIG